MKAFKHQCLLAILLLSAFASPAVAEEYDDEPINYSKSTPHNSVSRLIDGLQSGKVRLQHEARYGYLRSLLKSLEIPVSSQTLVYSKTSLQRHRIAPATPRALYFNDDVYVGYCQDGEVLEISAADPQLGAVFYTLSQSASESPKLNRQADNCLICHASSQTRQVPGFVLRSVFVDASGLPILSAGSHRIDQSSPIANRWGGWYVTGTHGPQKHMGNLVIHTETVPNDIDNSAGMNLTNLGDRFDRSAYLTAHSDLVALLVLEHQAEAHNRITRANYVTRQALHYQKTLNQELKYPANHVWPSTASRIKSAAEPLVEYLLFSGEAELTHRITGTSGFAAEFVRQGARDHQGRSLRDFDLQRRMFKYPCSYLVYSPSFQALPRDARDYVFNRLWKILSGEDQSKEFAHLTTADRQAILEILRDTLPNLPKSWKIRRPAAH